MSPTLEGAFIVGIGSSAGGLEAIRELVGFLPQKVAASYVIVQHMSPKHASQLAELISKQTELSVVEVTDGTTPKPNVVYVTPPKSDILYKDGRLQLTDPNPSLAAPKPSVDRFLMSLAEHNGEKSMAVILSGTGSDGAYGVQSIREAGGITIAQDSGSAKYDGMPNSAMETGCVDLVLSPAQIGKHLEKILTLPRDFSGLNSQGSENQTVNDLLQILKARTRVDFREYKQSTVHRRIQRRMVALGIPNQEDYTRFCRENPIEVDNLFKDLLISVTRFFRDHEEFEKLNQSLADLTKEQIAKPLRIWVAGCATGEEAYSIAILLAEHLGGAEQLIKERVQIFATDIDEAALRIARTGRYNISALDGVPTDLAQKYFAQEQDGVKINPTLRSAILFSKHNVCQDPPFQRLDLICCRNVLIYFGNSLQVKVMKRFHYGLNPNGYLFLGTAEGILGSEANFEPIRKNGHLYRKRPNGNSSSSFSLDIGTKTNRIDTPKQTSLATKTQPEQQLEMFNSLARAVGRDAILLNEDCEILRIFGDVSKFVELSEGSKLGGKLSLLRSPLREEARSLVTLALRSGVRRQGIPQQLDKRQNSRIQMQALPIVSDELEHKQVLLTFELLEQKTFGLAEDGTDFLNRDATSARVKDLEAELATTREALQRSIQELETTNEELQTLNQESQSTNEELQATNEELETSNEELQSTNEELITVNEELQVNASELIEKTSELSSILETVPIPLMVTDEALQITQASARACGMLQLSLPLRRPHISQCVLPAGFPSLVAISTEVIQTGNAIERKISSSAGDFNLICTPILDAQGSKRGITIIFAVLV